MKNIDREDIGMSIVQIAVLWVAIYTFRVDRRVATFWVLYCWLLLDKNVKKQNDSQDQEKSKDADESIACLHKWILTQSKEWRIEMFCTICKKFFYLTFQMNEKWCCIYRVIE